MGDERRCRGVGARCVAAAAGLLVLSACGGGGGGSGGSAEPAPPPVPVSMIPAAPALGDTLHADATALRPLAAGMRWTYAGVRTSGAVTDRYDSNVRIEAGASGGIAEKAWQVFQAGPDNTTLSIVNGTVTATQTVDMGGSPFTVTAVELRSPVRVNDQTTVLERNGVATDVDIDGDKKPDTADVAYYRRVIGNEDVELPALGQTVRAVRVDDTAIVRLHRSSDGATVAPVTTTGSTWYAPGLGIVRRTLAEPAVNGQADQYDERLQAFDGLSRGVGALMHTRPDQPALQGLLGQTLVAAAPVGERVLALSRHTPAGAQPVLRLAVLDASGNVVSSRVLDGISATQEVEPVLIGSDTQALLVVRETVVRPDPYVHYQLRAWRFDAAGMVVGPAAGSVLPLDEMHYQGSYRIAGDGGQWWAMWQGSGGDGQLFPMPLYLQGFDGTSLAAVTARHVLEPGALFVSPRILGLSAAGGRVAAAWMDGAAGAQAFRVAQLTADGAPAVATLGRAGTSWMALGVGNTEPLALLRDGRPALYWTYAAFTPGAGPAAQMRGAVLGSDGAPVRTVPGGLDDELLPTAWALPSTTPVALGGAGSLLLGSWGYAPWRTGDTLTTAQLQLTQALPAAAAGLATAPAAVQRWRAFDTLYGANGGYGTFTARRWVMLKDRVLVLDDDLRTVGLAFLR